MLPMQVALVPQTNEATPDGFLHVAAALQKQVIRDLAPCWGVSATVAPFLELEQVPPGYWPVVLVEEPLMLARRGVHFASGARPFALVTMSDSWSLTASHELLELLVDPWGNWTLSGRSLYSDRERDDETDDREGDTEPQGQVEYLVEVCDPCQAAEHAYTIDGVLLSDFVTPEYYGPRQRQGTGVQYSFTGAVPGPRQVLPGGYLTWRVPGTNAIWQAFGSEPEIRRLGTGGFPSDVSMREWVDAHPDSPTPPDSLPKDEEPLKGAAQDFEEARKSANSYGQVLRRDIDRLRLPLESDQSDPERDRIESLAKLLEALATSEEDRDAFVTNREKVLEKYNITVDLFLPPPGTPLPPPEDFEEFRKRLAAGDRFGTHYNQPFGEYWIMAVLGGY